MILTLRPIRAFLSMIARSMTELAPMPSAGGPVAGSRRDWLRVFREIDPHDVSIADRHVVGDTGSDADHRVLDHRSAADHACRRRSGCS